MADIVLFHSAYGLRPAVLDAAERLRGWGHRVATPDLYRGRVANTLEEGLALRDGIGREELLHRARVAVVNAAAGTVLAGFSLGAALAHRIAAADARFDRLLLLHGVAEAPAATPTRWSVQVHVAEGDAWSPRDEVDAWRGALERLGASIQVHFYPSGGHLFTDPELPDHDARAAAEVWRRAERFLAGQDASPVYRETIAAMHAELGIPADYSERFKLALCEEAAELVSIGSDMFGRKQRLAPLAADAWRRMRAAARRDGVRFLVVSAFRSVDSQRSIIARKLDKGRSVADILQVNAAPGYSEHHTGRALDLTTPGSPPLEQGFESTGAFTWLTSCAAQHGFRLSYPRDNPHGISYEPWHWAFAG